MGKNENETEFRRLQKPTKSFCPTTTRVTILLFR
jgi:hypothetical protein